MSILAGIAGLGSAIIGNALNSAQNERQREWTEYMYLQDRAYNSPVNQVKRLRQAGINPQLAMSNGMLGSGNSTGAPSAPAMHPYDFSPAAQGVARSVELSNQKRMIDADVSIKNAQAEGLQIDNFYKADEHVANLQKIKAEYEKLGKDTSFIDWQIDRSMQLFGLEQNQIAQDILLKRAQTRLESIQADLVDVQAQKERILMSFTESQQKIITDNLIKEGHNIDAQTNLNNRSAAVAIAERALKEAQKSGVDISNNQIKEMSEYVVDEAYYKKEEQKYKSGIAKKEYRLGYATGRVAPAYHKSVQVSQPHKRNKVSSSTSGVR